MESTLSILIERMEMPKVADSGIIPWACPVPTFGGLGPSAVATLGLNPSNREFLDPLGNELEGNYRRFHTLGSLRLSRWSEAGIRHFRYILELCENYFLRNPYDQWFKRLDYLISGTGYSYYTPMMPACHLDLIPYATTHKWAALDYTQRSSLLTCTADTLGLLLRYSTIQILILNGSTVTRTFEDVSDVAFIVREMPGWSLPRRSGKGVAGLSYKGVVRSVGGVAVGRDVLVLGYNHNIQSSFGVTKKVQSEIKKWITRETVELFK